MTVLIFRPSQPLWLLLTVATRSRRAAACSDVQQGLLLYGGQDWSDSDALGSPPAQYTYLAGIFDFYQHTT